MSIWTITSSGVYLFNICTGFSMAVNLKCPNLKCRMLLKVPDKSRGQRVRCSYCSTILLVPDQAKTNQLRSALKASRSDNNDE